MLFPPSFQASSQVNSKQAQETKTLKTVLTVALNGRHSRVREDEQRAYPESKPKPAQSSHVVASFSPGSDPCSQNCRSLQAGNSGDLTNSQAFPS